MTQQGRASTVAFALVLAAGLGLGACATSPPSPTGPTVESIVTTASGDRAQVVVQGSQPLEYTAFRLTDPSRVIVDLPGAALGGAAGVHPGIAPGMGDVSATEVTEGGARVARLEIPVDPATAFTVTPDAAAGTLTIELTGPGVRLAEPAGVAAPTLDAALEQPAAAAPSASPSDLTAPGAVAAASPEPAAAATPSAAPAWGPLVVRAVRPRAEGRSTELLIEASAPVARYEVFRLASPARLVVDIQDARNRVSRRQIPVNDARVRAVRLGSHREKVRVVLDLAGRGDAAYEVSPDPRGLLVTLKAAERTVAAPAPTPATTEAVPSPSEGAGAVAQKAATTAVAPVPDSRPVEPVAGRPGDGGLPVIRPYQAVALQRAVTIGEPARRYTGRRISLDFKDADIDNVLRLIAEISNLNIVTSSEVKGTISLRLVNVPWDQALDIILQSQGLGMERTGNVIRIAPAAKLKAEDDAAIAAKAAKQKLEDLTLEIIPVNYAIAKDLESQLKPLLSERGKLTVDTRTNALIVTDVRSAIEQARALVGALDTVTPQVLIEARIVEASLDFTRELGVQWGGTATFSQTTKNGFNGDFPEPLVVTGGAGSGFAVNLPAAIGAGAGGGLNFTLGSLSNFLNLDIRLSALERTGEGRIISSPRVTTLDNKEAVIEQGLSIPFETTSDSGTQTTFIDANLNLTVTPHVTNDESINLKIKASKNAPDTSVRGASGAPSISKKEAKTEVLIQDGHTTVIGGIYQIDRSDSVAGVPWFHRLPLLGWLFKKTTVTDKKTELLIFITPRIVRPTAQQAATR